MTYPIIDALTGSTVFLNGRFYESNSVEVAQLQKPCTDRMVYEVIRIVHHVPLFWEDHIARLKRSLDGQIQMPGDLRENCIRLIRKNAVDGRLPEQTNLRIVLTDQLAVIHMIPSYYPTSQQFQQGVPVLILDWERENPNIKMIRADYKAAVAQAFSREGPYGRPFELLLADRQGYLTEGSRSNLFFIRGNNVLSAPDSRILKGITRQYVIEAMSRAGAVLTETMITRTELADNPPQAAFLSGSPIDLLPISSIESTRIPSAGHPLFLRINEAYQQILHRYIHAQRDIEMK